MKIRFETAQGTIVEAEASENDVLLAVAQGAGMPLEGTCEGQMACSTCHVVVERDWFAALPDASEDEEDMLDLAYGVRPTSRLACQIVLTEALDGLTVTIPPEARDMSGG